MRVISGYLKGRRFNHAHNLPVRPTTDLAKESIFNIINNNFDFEKLNVLDLFSGTGNIAIEFASRGCLQVTAVELNFKCVDFIKKTAEKFSVDNLNIVKTNVFNFLKFAKNPFDIIFADPPYDMTNTEQIPNLIFNNNLLSEGGWLIIEHSRNIDFKNHNRFYDHRLYGKVNFSIFS